MKSFLLLSFALFHHLISPVSAAHAADKLVDLKEGGVVAVTRSVNVNWTDYFQNGNAHQVDAHGGMSLALELPACRMLPLQKKEGDQFLVNQNTTQLSAGMLLAVSQSPALICIGDEQCGKPGAFSQNPVSAGVLLVDRQNTKNAFYLTCFHQADEPASAGSSSTTVDAEDSFSRALSFF